MKSPFKVMSTAALAAAVAVPTLSVPAADAAETSSFHSVALETEDGSVKTVPFMEYAKAKTFGSGNLGEFVEANSVVGVSAEEGKFVSVRTLALAKIEDTDADTASLLADLDDSEDNLVAEEDVAEYTEWTDEEEVVAPAVESVSANNLKQLTVEYSGDFDAKLAENTDSYTLEDANGNEETIANVSLEGNTATITLASNVDNQTELDLTVDSDVTGEEYTEEAISFFDTTIPEVTGAEVAGKDTIKVKFSEPLAVYNDGSNENPEWLTVNGDQDVEDAFEVEGGDYYIKSVDVLNNGTEVNVTTYADLEEGELEVSIDNMLEDYAGFNVTSKTETVEVVKDEDIPEVVDYKNASPRQVTLVFNEDIQLQDDSVSDFYHTNSNNIVDSYEVNGNELTLKFVGDTEDNPLPEGTAYVYIDGETVVDLWGNVNDNQIRSEVEVTVDETAPVLEDLSLKSGTKVELTFSEDVTASDSDFTLLNKDGDEIENAIKDVTVSEDTVTVETYDTMTGDYALVVDGVEDVSGNDLDKVTENFNVDDTSAPDLEANASAKIYDATEDVQKIVVNYPEAMALDGKYSVLDVEKYELTGGDLGSDVALSDVTGVNIKALEDGQSVEITIPADETDGGLDLSNTGYNLNIGRVADDSANYTSKFSSSVAVSTPGSVSVGDVYATSTDTVVVELGDRLVDFDADDFELATDLTTEDENSNGKIDIAKVDTSLDASGNTVITFTTDEELPYYLNEGSNLQFDVVGSSSVNKFDEPVNTVTKAVEDVITPVLSYDTSADETVADAYSNTTANQIDIEFSEDLENSNDDLYAQDLVVLEDGQRLVSGVDFTTAVSVSTLQIQSGDTTIDPANHTYTVKSKSSIEYIEDTNGNLADAFTTAVQIEDGIEPTLATTSHVAENKSSVEFDLGGDAQNDINFAADAYGDNGDGITVELVDNDTSGSGTTASYDSASNTVTVELADDGTGSITADVDAVVSAVNGLTGDDAVVTASAINSGGTVVATTANGDTANGSDEQISITFSEDMNQSTLNAASEITVTDGTSTERTLGTTPEFNWTAADTLEINLDSDNDVASNDEVTATDAEDQNGNSVDVGGSADVVID